MFRRRLLASYSLVGAGVLVLSGLWFVSLPPNAQPLFWLRVRSTLGGRYEEDPIALKLRRRFLSGELTEAARRSLLRDWVSDEKGLIETRRQWPVGSKILVRLREAEWLAGQDPRSLELAPVRADLATLTVGFFGERSPMINPTGDDRQELGTLAPGRQIVSFELRLLEYDGTILWSLPVTRSFLVSGSLTDCIHPSADPSVTQELSRVWFSIVPTCIEVAPSADRATPATYRPCLNVDWPRQSGGSKIARAFRIEFMEQGAVLGTARIWCPLNDLAWIQPAVVEGDIQTILGPTTLNAGAAIRIVADPELALREFESTVYWSGELIVPGSSVRVGP